VAAVRSAAMMLEFLGEASAAARLEEACAASAGYAGTTAEIGDAIAERV
jgi:isocitrate/isopropylmalate dehydrogenase